MNKKIKIMIPIPMDEAGVANSVALLSTDFIRDGIDVIILGSATRHQSHGYLTSVLSIPVINSGVIYYKLCEVLLDLGLMHSKHAFHSPE